MTKSSSLLLLALLCLLSACSLQLTASSTDCCAAVPPSESAIAACRSVLNAQVVGWNSGSIDAFAAGYHKAPDIVMASSEGVGLGYDSMLSHYKSSYGTPALMGQLRFESLSFVTLNDTEILCFGAWHLKRTQDEPHGRFALVMRSFPEGWRITLDYTSVLP
ncbi:MAG: nuclear transport factor 2 family protein [Planctomycetes bacterium]|nr:nuclear transport factor 2 family protein [Planctomycetota bacterium]